MPSCLSTTITSRMGMCITAVDSTELKRLDIAHCRRQTAWKFSQSSFTTNKNCFDVLWNMEKWRWIRSRNVVEKKKNERRIENHVEWHFGLCTYNGFEGKVIMSCIVFLTYIYYHDTLNWRFDDGSTGQVTSHALFAFVWTTFFSIHIYTTVGEGAIEP